MFVASIIPPEQLMMVAGFILLAWVLVRRRLSGRRRLRQEVLASDKAAARQTAETSRSLPLADAPLETQRWQVAMFELHRDLKADLDTRIAVVGSLLRQVDQRIAHLESLQQDRTS